MCHRNTFCCITDLIRLICLPSNWSQNQQSEPIPGLSEALPRIIVTDCLVRQFFQEPRAGGVSGERGGGTTPDEVEGDLTFSILFS